MSNFDLRVTLSGSTAKVLLFPVNTITFQQSSGAWQLIAAKDVCTIRSKRHQLPIHGPAGADHLHFSSTGALMRIEDRNGTPSR